MWLSQLFHSKPTAFTPADDKHLDGLIQSALRPVLLEITILRRNIEDLEEKHSRRLNSLRAQVQIRKDGKFGPTDGSESTIEPPPDGNHSALSHRDIEALARKKGIMQ